MAFEDFVKTKMIATVGPSTASNEQLRGLVEAGVDVLRINMGHTDLDHADEVIARIRRLTHRVAVLLDLQGPKLRITDVPEPFELQPRDVVPVRNAGEPTDREALRIPVAGLIEQLRRGHRILIADGKLELRVVSEQSEGEVRAEVVHGGTVEARKGVAVPDTRFVPEVYLDESDQRDVRFAARRQVDFVAASYVSRAADVDAVRRELGDEAGHIGIIAKIETGLGLERIEEILETTDGVMVARGDLGVEIPPEKVPLAQKQLIKRSNAAAKPVIVATQMLDSMIHSPVPSRAETSDVANAILDGTDAVMLSAETSIGSYPIEAVRTLERIARHVEHEVSMFQEELFRRPSSTTVEFICKAVGRAAEELSLDAIVAFTSSGFTARNMSAYRPSVPIVTTSPSDRIVRRLSLQYAVHCVQAEHLGRYDVMLYRNVEKLTRKGLLERDDRIAIIGGVPVGKPGSTNMFQVATVRELLDEVEPLAGP